MHQKWLIDVIRVFETVNEVTTNYYDNISELFAAINHSDYDNESVLIIMSHLRCTIGVFGG
jgi:hypothetical protein